MSALMSAFMCAWGNGSRERENESAGRGADGTEATHLGSGQLLDGVPLGRAVLQSNRAPWVRSIRGRPTLAPKGGGDKGQLRGKDRRCPEMMQR